jgi:hypothetical protein
VRFEWRCPQSGASYRSRRASRTDAQGRVRLWAFADARHEIVVEGRVTSFVAPPRGEVLALALDL